MYPRQFYEIYPAFPDSLNVFVIMSFSDEYASRWTNVIAPAIRLIKKGNVPLNPFRVDSRTIGDSILTDILQGIRHSIAVFADITSMGRTSGKPYRNGNVMYELGIAHAVRLPEEVVIFRSDSDNLLFDTSNIRINQYDPDGQPDEARKRIIQALLNSLREVDLKRHMTVERISASLDVTSMILLTSSQGPDGLRHPPSGNMGEALANSQSNACVQRLLEMGVISADFMKFSKDNIASVLSGAAENLVVYRTTQLGAAVCDHLRKKMNIDHPDVQSAILGYDSK